MALPLGLAKAKIGRYDDNFASGDPPTRESEFAVTSIIVGEGRCSFGGDEGEASAELASFKTVGVKHLSEVNSVNSILGSRLHVVRFINGSVLPYAYNSAGDLLESSSENLACRLSPDGELLSHLP